MNAVAGNQHFPFFAAPVRKRYCYPAWIAFSRSNLAASCKLYVRFATNNAKQRVKQIGAMRNPIGGSKTLLECFAKNHSLQHPAFVRVANLNFPGSCANWLNCIPNAQMLERAHRVWADLEACAHFLESLRFLENSHSPAAVGYGESRRHTTDAAARYETVLHSAKIEPCGAFSKALGQRPIDTGTGLWVSFPMR
jgi:hypothetical protein